MTIDEWLASISQQIEILTGLQHANERRFEMIARFFARTDGLEKTDGQEKPNQEG
jgi:hypothetical protein